MTCQTYKEDAACLVRIAITQGKPAKITNKMGRKARKPTDYVWTPEREEMLLTFWEDNAFLYNLELKDYSNLEKKRRVYNEFAEKMGTTGMLSNYVVPEKK